MHMYVGKIVFKVSLVRFSGRSALAIEKDIVDASEVLLQGIKTCRVAGKVLLFLGSSKVEKKWLSASPKLTSAFSPGAYILIFTLQKGVFWTKGGCLCSNLNKK